MNKRLTKIIVSAVLLAVAMVVQHTVSWPLWALLLVFLVPYLTAGWETLEEALEGIAHGEAFNEDFLMAVATIGALAIGFLPGAEPEFAEAVFVMLFFQVGELFEDYAEGKSRRAISHLMDIRPDTAHVEREESVLSVDPNTVLVGETIVVRPGEKVPLDATIVEGTSSLNTVALTGESMPRSVGVGDAVVSGCVNISGLLRARVDKTFGASTASKIIELVENASENKSKSERFITRFSRIYTPVVVFSALLLAIVPPMILGDFVGTFPTWLGRALMFLVVSCPCALVISVPLTFFGGIGGASRRGILVKGANYMDTLAKLSTVVFDKTGTLTKGTFEVTAVHPEACDERHLLHLAAHVERFSTHPIAISLRNAYADEQDGCRVENVEEVAGQGVRASVNGTVVCVGNTRMMDAVGAKWTPCEHPGTVVHVAADGKYLGHVVVSDEVKADAAEAIAGLKQQGVGRTVMLTGDRKEAAAHVAATLALDDWHAELLPTDKVSIMEQLMNEKPEGTTQAFVGDGINDAPVLARADVGIAMGGLGSDAAIEAADVVIMDDHPSKIATAMAIARRTLHIATENIWMAIGIKLAVLCLAAVGLATMWMAVFADVGVTVLAVLNAMRALQVKA